MTARPTRWPALALFAALLCIPLDAIPAQSAGADDGGPKIEELEKKALEKLKESHRATRNKMDYLVTQLAKGEREAEAAARQLVTYGRYPLADNRTVAEHLVARFLDAKSTTQRQRLGAVLQRLAPILREKKAAVLALFLGAAEKADHRLPAIVDVLVAMQVPEVTDHLEPLLGHQSALVRVSVIRLFGRSGRRELAAKLSPSLGSPDREVRLAVIQAFRDLEYKGGIGALEKLVNDQDAQVAEGAVGALADFKAREAVPILLLALQKSTDAARSRRLIDALGRIGTATKVSVQARVEKVLQGYLSSKNDSLVSAAGYALARLGKAGSEVERALTRHLRTEAARDPRNTATRLEIARTLKRLGECAGSKSFFQKAVKEYKSILRDHKRSAEYHTNTYIELAGCLARQGQFKSAARYLDRVPRKYVPLSRLLSNNPDFAEMSKEPAYRRFFEEKG